MRVGSRQDARLSSLVLVPPIRVDTIARPPWSCSHPSHPQTGHLHGFSPKCTDGGPAPVRCTFCPILPHPQSQHNHVSGPCSVYLNGKPQNPVQ
jgi:hypothetical protein